MNSWAILVIVAVIVLLLTALFLGIIQPVWCLIDVAKSQKQKGWEKGVWIVFTLILWGFTNLVYGLLRAESPRLKKLTIVGVVLAILSTLGAVAGISFNPDVHKMVTEAVQSKLGRAGSPSATVSVQETQSVVVESIPQPPEPVSTEPDPEENPPVLSETDQMMLDAALLLAEGKSGLAAQKYAEILKDKPYNLKAKVEYGHALMQSGKKKKGSDVIQAAINQATKAIQKQPKNGRLYYIRGTGHRYLGRYQKAINNLEKAINLSPERTNYPADLKAIQAEKKMAESR